MTEGFVPYGRQTVDTGDVDAVVDVLQSDWLTTGPAVSRFEDSFAEYVDSGHAVAVSNGTAALHLSMLAADVGPGDEVIVPAMTFAASANCARYVGAEVVFADVREDTLTIDPDHASTLVTERTRAVIAVDYAGVPCDIDDLAVVADRHGLVLVEDAAHSPGARYRDRNVGSLADLTTFSFHPVKHLTTGEGGMVTTDDPGRARRLRRLRNHGIDTDFREREEVGTWMYDLSELGFNYRLSDINCALGAAQLEKLPRWLDMRRERAARYEAAFAEVPLVRTLVVPEDRASAWHLYPVRLGGEDPAALRQDAFETLRANGIGVNVHYRPVHHLTYYRSLGYERGLCPVAESAYEGLLSLPMWPGLTPEDQDRTIDILLTVVDEHG